MKLTDAINTIVEECNKHAKCNDCPLRCRNNSCGIVLSRPDNWKFKKDKEPVPRIFR